MKIFPAIDIKDGKCVRLIKGDFDKKTEYKISPVEQASKYKDHGFKNLHIVDLDGALTGETVNINITPGSPGKKISANKDFFKISTENLKYLTKLVETSSFYKKIIYQLILLKISIIKLLLFRHI